MRTAHGDMVKYCNNINLQAFETKDGYVMVGAGNDGQFVELCKVSVRGPLLHLFKDLSEPVTLTEAGNIAGQQRAKHLP